MVVSAMAVAAACGESGPAGRPVAAPDGAVASVTSVSGDVRVRRHAAGAWIPLLAGAALGSDDIIQALDGGQAELKLRSTGVTLAITGGTTMRLDETRPPKALSGRFVAKVATSSKPTRFSVSLPPGELVLTTNPPAQPVAEAAIEVTPDHGAIIEVAAGQAQLIAPGATAVALVGRRKTRFDAAGKVVQADTATVVALQSPADGARVRVRQAVSLRWGSTPLADGYRILLHSGAIQRSIEVGTPTAAVRLSSGHYSWSVQAIHAAQLSPQSEERSFDLEVDSEPPPLAIEVPGEGASVNGPKIRVAGSTEPGSVIDVARTRAVADASGRFAVDIKIAHGLSNLVITASDDVGNQRRVTRSVVWQ
jgi:hypothetical protein